MSGRLRTLTVAVVVPAVLALTVACAPGLGQDEDGNRPSETPQVRGRLPAYFAAVVTPQQRKMIYEIQAKYNGQISELEGQIESLRGERDKEVDGVLSPEQLAEVNKKREAAKQRRGARSEPTVASESSSDEPG